MNRLSDEKACAIAAEYCTNGFKKVMALLSIGYKESYANNPGLKLFDNVKVKRAIAKIQASTLTKTAMTVEKVQKMYEQDRKFARKVNQAGASVSATTGIARLYGMDKDSGGGREQTIIIISPKSRKAVDSKEIEDVEG